MKRLIILLLFLSINTQLMSQQFVNPDRTKTDNLWLGENIFNKGIKLGDGYKNSLSISNLNINSYSIDSVTIENSNITTTSFIICNIQSFSGPWITEGLPEITAVRPNDGSLTIIIYNNSSYPLQSVAVLSISYLVIN
jgi:hypothetical protein